MYRRRLNFIQDLLTYGYGHLFYVDADSIINRYDPDLIPFVESCELTMRIKTFDDDYDKREVVGFSGSTLGIKCNDIGKEFYQRYCEYNEHDYTEMATQYLLSNAYNDVRDRINFNPLPRIYCNPWHGDDAVIWEGNGSKKKKKDFIREMKRVENA